MLVLGIESSCDDHGVALYSTTKGLLGHLLQSQHSIHNPHQGIVPELASRDHIRHALPLIIALCEKTGIHTENIDAIAYTAGPGLMGSLLVGATMAKSIAFAWDLPSVGIHHLEGHLLSPMLEENPPAYPFLALLVSGGHTLLVQVAQPGQYQILGTTLDDAVGEAFDKSAKALGLGYPGGPKLAALAATGRADALKLPRPLIHKGHFNFSFSGLKTATLYAIQSGLYRREDIAAAFECAAIDVLIHKSCKALKYLGYSRLVIAGGVGANCYLRDCLQNRASKDAFSVFFPRPEFCTDNGAMIAYAGSLRIKESLKKPRELSIEARPRWDLSALPAL
jgi:N6-L-threonylcarbamoyladenine synthase